MGDGNYIALGNKKHILVLTPGFPKNDSDTTCIPALQLFIKELQQTGKVDISLIAFQYPYKSNTYYWNNVTVYSIGGENKKGVQRFLNWRKIVKTATKIHQEKRINLVHSFWLTECAFVGNKIAQKLAVQHYCTLMGQDGQRDNKYVTKINPFPKIITLSKFHTRTLVENTGIQPQYIIPWGIEKIKNIPKVTKSIDILGVGNLIPLKGYDRFISVVKEVQYQFPSVKAEIIGEGPEMKRLQRMIIDNNLNQNIRLIGKIERAEVLQKMSKSNCLLHLSNYESFGMVLIEALAQGMNVFSNKVGIAEELEDIAIVEGKKDAAEKIITLLNHPKERAHKFPLLIDDTVKSYLDKVFLDESEKDI